MSSQKGTLSGRVLKTYGQTFDMEGPNGEVVRVWASDDTSVNGVFFEQMLREGSDLTNEIQPGEHVAVQFHVRRQDRQLKNVATSIDKN